MKINKLTIELSNGETLEINLSKGQSRQSTIVSDFDKLLQKFKRIIRKAGGRITRSRLLRSLKIRARDMDELERTLKEQGSIEVAVVNTGNNGRPAMVYTLIENIQPLAIC